MYRICARVGSDAVGRRRCLPPTGRRGGLGPGARGAVFQRFQTRGLVLTVHPAGAPDSGNAAAAAAIGEIGLGVRPMVGQ